MSDPKIHTIVCHYCEVGWTVFGAAARDPYADVKRHVAFVGGHLAHDAAGKLTVPLEQRGTRLEIGGQA